jgi:hypothetical protein
MLPTPTKSRLWRRSARRPRPGSPWAVVPLTGKQPNNGAEASVGECRLSLAFTGASHTWSHVLSEGTKSAPIRECRVNYVTHPTDSLCDFAADGPSIWERYDRAWRPST